MSGPRYSIIPHEFFADTRPLMAHVRVMGVLGRHSNETGWCRLKQATVAAEAEISRETVCRALTDLETWGYVEKAKGKGRSLCYRVVMDSKKPPPDDLEEEVVHIGGQKAICDVQITSAVTPEITSDVTQQITSAVTSDVTSNERPSLTTPIERKTRESASEDSNLDLKGKGALPAIALTASDVSWSAWLEHLNNIGRDDLAGQASAAGRMTVAARWPTAETPLPIVGKGRGLTERSKAMAGEGA